MNNVKFSDLSVPNEIAIILAWISGLIFAGTFVVGFIGAVLYG